MTKNSEPLPRTSRDKLILIAEVGVLAAGAMALMRHREDAEDLLQDTYEKALKGLNNFRGDSEVKTWMTRIMINQSIDKKSLAVQRETPVDPEQFELAETPSRFLGQPEASLALREDLDLIYQLAEDEREILLLRASGYKFEEIAHELGQPTGTVKSREFRARQKLLHLREAA